MKRIKFILLALVIANFSRAATVDGDFNLSVSSDGKLVIQQVQLLNADGYEKTIKNGSGAFSFTSQIDRYGVFNLSVTYLDATTKKTNGLNVQLFLKPGETSVLFQGTSGKYIVTGASAESQRQFQSFVTRDQLYLNKVMKLETKLREARQSGNRPAVARVKDSLASAQNARIKDVLEAFILQHPNDDLSIYVMRIYSSVNMENPTEVLSLISKMGRELQQTDEIKEIVKGADENTKLMVGVKAPAFTQADTGGVPVALSSFQGKYVLIDFWASWCKPCRAQNPGLVRLYKKYKSSGFTILSVSLDAKKEAWLKAIEADRLEWQNVSDLQFWSNAVAKQYKITHVPQSYLLNREGVIIAKNLTEDDLDELLEKEFSTK